MSKKKDDPNSALKKFAGELKNADPKGEKHLVWRVVNYETILRSLQGQMRSNKDISNRTIALIKKNPKMNFTKTKPVKI